MHAHSKFKRTTVVAAVLTVMMLASGGIAAASVGANAKTKPAPAPITFKKPLSITVAEPFVGFPPTCCQEDYAGSQLGFYRKLKLDVNFTQLAGSALPIQALIGGRVDIATAYITAGLAADLAGAHLVYIGAILNGNYTREIQAKVNPLYIGTVYAASKDVNSIKDLAGKTVGIATGTNSSDPNYLLISALLNANGLSPSSVTWAVVGTQSLRTAALLSGRINFTNITYDSLGTIQTSTCCHLITIAPPSTAWQGWAGATGWWVNASELQDPQKLAAIERFVIGSIEGSRAITNTKSSFEKLSTYYDPTFGQQPQTDQSFAWNIQRQSYCPNGCMNLTDMQGWLTQDYMKLINPSAGNLSLHTFVNAGPVSYALKKLGTVDKSTVSDPPQLKFPTS